MRAGILMGAIFACSCQFDISGVAPEASEPEIDASTPAPAPSPDGGRIVEPDAATGDPGPGPDPGPDPTEDCPLDYARLGVAGNVYRLGFDVASWDQAETDCEADGDGTHLVVVDDLNELVLVALLIGVGDSWIGVRRTGNGPFVSVLGTPLPNLPFVSGEPNQNGTVCLLANGPQGALSDDKCSKRHRYICECDGVPPADGN